MCGLMPYRRTQRLGRGREDEALRMVSHCMLCGKCLIVCPRGINTRHLILSVTKIYQKK